MLVLSNSPAETKLELQVPEDLEAEVTMFGFFFFFFLSPFCWPFHFQPQNILINYKFNIKKNEGKILHIWLRGSPPLPRGNQWKLAMQKHARQQIHIKASS